MPAVVLAAVIQGCAGASSTPTQPQPLPGLAGPPTPEVDCTIEPSLRCTAFVYGEGDVTAAASWSAADSFQLAMDVPVTPSRAVIFNTPGVPTVLSPANIYIRADYASPIWGHLRAIAFHAYGVAPFQSAVPLAYLQGYVYSGVLGGSTVPGATVEITAGEDAGKSATTNVVGFYMLEFVRLGQPFTIRASKSGYISNTQDHPAIVDNSGGAPGNSTIHFVIQPVN